MRIVTTSQRWPDEQAIRSDQIRSLSDQIRSSAHLVDGKLVLVHELVRSRVVRQITLDAAKLSGGAV